jgi:hypothetical protein
MIAIQFESGGAGNWYQINRTERFANHKDRVASSNTWATDGTDGVVHWDMVLRTLIVPGDIDAQVGLNSTTDTIDKIRAVCAIDKTGTPTVTLNRCQFTILPIHAEIV